MTEITGIVICGGKSFRFGNDKGMSMLGNKPMIQYSIDSLKPVCSKIIISSNDPKYNDWGFKTVADVIGGIGPIGGIISALEISETEDNLIISCDMPFLNHELFKYIIENKNNALAATPVFNGFIEPLCSYINKKSLYGLKQFIRSGGYKIIDILESINYKKIIIDDSLPFYNVELFHNINTPEQLEKALKILNFH
jgi:molybdenum cofactor guanylyltransferase